MSETPIKQTSEVNAEVSNTDAAHTESPARAQHAPKKNGGTYILIFVVVILAALGGAWALGAFSGLKEDANEDTTEINPADVVATVNGSTITRGEFEDMLANVRASLGAQADAVDSATLEESVLNDMIDMQLLVEAADEQGVTVSEEEVQTQYTTFTSAVPDADELAAELGRLGLDEEQLKFNIEQELRVRKLLDTNTDLEEVSVTDAEIATLYEDAKTNAPEGGEIPPLEDVVEIARAQILQEKSAEIINAYLAELRADAVIETSL